MRNEVGKELVKLKEQIMEGIPQIVANTAVDYFQDTFRYKKFDGTPWPDFSPNYRHRTNGSLMIDSAALMNSIRPSRIERKVVEISAGNDKVDYAKPHNEGFTGSVVVPQHTRTNKKGKTFVIKQHTRKMFLPQRQFLGESKELNELIIKRIGGFADSITKK